MAGLSLLGFLLWAVWPLICVAGDAVITPLVAGEATSGSLQAHEYIYYSTPGVHSLQEDLTIAVTPLSGDPDLYVSVNKKYPTMSDYTWSRAHLGGDTITIPAENPESCGAKEGCVYYIGIYGYAAATYTILASWTNAEPVKLRPGQPQADHVPAGGYKQYAFNVTPGTMADGGIPSDLQVLVTPVLGDSDLFVTLDGSRPLSDHFQYRSASWGDVQDRVVIHRNDSEYLHDCASGSCLLRAAVYGFHEADFTIVASAYAEAIALQHGVPLESTVPPDTYQRFTAVWDSAVDDLLISLSPQSGSPRLYVSCLPALPNATSSYWTLDTARSSSQLLRLDPASAAKHKCALPTTVSMAVLSDSLSSFSLLASVDASTSVPLLVPGVPLSGEAQFAKLSYYQIRLGETYADVDVILSVRSGEVDLYVSDSYEGRPVYDPVKGVQNYTLKSANDGDDRVSISHSHFKPCQPGEPCYYIVGVLGSEEGRRSEYSIVAKKTDSTITLQDGVPVKDFVGPRMYEYFRVKVVDPRADLTISTTPFSGDPDLYISVPPNYHPSKENHTWASKGFGADTLTLQAEALKQHCTPDPIAGRGCDYYIGVYGWTNTSFSIMAALNMGWQNPISLQPGQPQTGHVDSGAYRYYQFSVPEGGRAAAVHIRLSPEEESDQDLYVTMDRNKEPGKAQYDFKSASWEREDEVVIPTTSDKYCSGCTINIAVFGYEEGDYTLSVSLSNDQTALQLGVPLRASVPAEGSASYSVDWQSFVDDLILTLTPESGRPQLYASCVEPFPNATAHDWALDTRDGSVLRLGGSDGEAKGCHAPGKLWLSVAGAQTLSSYTMLVSTNASSSVPLLVPGRQVSGQVQYGKMGYYQIRLGKSYQDVDVILGVRSGEVDLYVSDSYEGRPVLDPFKGVTNYTLKSELPGDDRLHIAHSHFRTCDGDCYYIVGVLGNDAKAISEYTIVTKMQESVITLQDGVAVKDVVGPHMYEYFRVKVVDPGADLTISTTAFSGDPDLYISVPPNLTPTKENHTWASRGFGADTLTLQAEALKQYCTPDPAAGKGCDYYIGVYGWTNTSYSIMASLNMGWQSPLTLMPGQPQTGHVDKGSYQYYQFFVPADSQQHKPDIKLTLVPTEGSDQDMYVSTSRDREPGKAQYDFKATSWSGIDEVVIRPGGDKYCTDCRLYVAVSGYQEGDFQISATLTSELSKLQLGVPVQSALAAQSVDYYSVTLPPSPDDLIVSVTEQSGMPQLYASCVTPFPNATAHDWALDTRDGNLLRLNSSTAAAAKCSSGGSVYLAVSSSSAAKSVTYTLMAMSDSSSLAPLLVPGVQTSGSVKFGKMAYYQVRLGKAYQDVDVILNVRSGEVDLYVSDSYEGRPVFSPEAGVQNATMSSEAEGSDRLLIKHSHFAACSANCYYILGVLGRKPNKNEFSIVAKKVDSTITLQDGVAIKDVVGPHMYEYFRVTVIDPEADLTISTTPFSGDPDLYVSVPPNYHPSKENHTWAARGFGADTLTLQAEALKQHCIPDPVAGTYCDYYIGVYGWTNTSFSIMASLNMGWQNPALLFPGQPQTGHVATGAYQYYEYYVDEATPKVRFVLSSEGEADMDLYLTTSRDKEPGKSQFDLKSTTWAGEDSITFSASEAKAVFCQDCTLYLAVYGYEGGDFTLSVGGGANSFQTLQNSVPVTGSVDAGTTAYYKVYNGNPEAHVFIWVTTLAGDPDLYVVRSEAAGKDGAAVMPSKSKYDWKGNRVGDDSVEVLPSDPKFCSSCDYLVGVFGWTNTSFTITAAVEQLSVIPLAPGRPQSGHVASQSVRYYYTMLGNSAEDLRVSLTLLTGDAQLLVAEGMDTDHLPKPDDPASYQYKSKHASGGSAVLRVPAPHHNITSFAIAVVGLEDAEFSLTASLQQEPVMLQEGVPMQQAVSGGHMEYFVYTLTSHADVIITVTAIQGDPDVVASIDHDKPKCGEAGDDPDSPWSHTCTDYTWIAQSFSSDQLIIRHDLPCQPTGHTRVDPECRPESFAPGQDLHIGVFGFDDAVFTVTLTTGGGHTSLMAGRPQHGITGEGALCEHRTESGSCEETPADEDTDPVPTVQVAYFSFRVSPDDLAKDGAAHVSIVLEPQCNSTVTPCAPGCPCNPLTVYVQSCPESECVGEDMYPSSLPDHHQVAHIADTPHSTLFLSRDPGNPDNGFCDPRVTREQCNYYIAVAHTDKGRPAAFTISASTPRDVNVLPTHSNPPPPDGIVTSSLDAVVGQAKKYQMYADKGSSVLLSLEACTGDLSLAVCDGSCAQVYPSRSEYKFYADTTKTCTRAGCSPSVAALPRIALDKVSEDSYFVAVEGTGTYYLRVETTGGGAGSHATPILAPPSGDNVPALSDVRGDSVTISWKAAELYVARGGARVTPQRAKYRIYAFDDKALSKALEQPPERKPSVTTACGLEHYAAGQAGGATAKVATTEEGQRSYTMQGLSPGVSYRFVVLAVCDAECLRHVSKVTPSETLKLGCGGAVSCQEHSALYTPTYVQMAMGAGGRDGKGHAGGSGALVGLLVTVLVLTLLGMGLLYRKNRRLEAALQYEMTDTSNFTSPVTSSRRAEPGSPETPTSGTSFLARNAPGLGGGNKAGRMYQPLLTDDDVEDNYTRV